jgi:hypothetical protein
MLRIINTPNAYVALALFSRYRFPATALKRVVDRA